jgi:hypothetical protein
VEVVTYLTECAREAPEIGEMRRGSRCMPRRDNWHETC